jgi:crotonobetainyl-CoA:carnitine CoA-transferase CaiB-like acyl-CoA transferase
VAGLIGHPHLRRIEVDTPHGPVSYPAPAPIRDQARSYGRIPALGEHTERVRKEFG